MRYDHAMSRLLLFNKPYGVLPQFTDREGRPTLAGYIPIPKVVAAGRLDSDSEGLLVLTDDGALQHHITDPRHKLPKTYWVQVEGIPDTQALTRLAAGVVLNDGPTLPAEVRRIDAPQLWPRHPPIRVRAAIPTCWLELTIGEGRNRQVRRMTAAVGHPTLRLVRVAVGPWRLEGLMPGEWRELEPVAYASLLPATPRMAESDSRSGRGIKKHHSNKPKTSNKNNNSNRFRGIAK